MQGIIMHDKRSDQQGKTRDAAAVDQLPGKEKIEGKMPTFNGALQVQSNGVNSAVVVGAKSASLRQCKSFNSKDTNLVYSKAPKPHESSKISSRSNGAALSSSCNGSKVDALPAFMSAENGGKVTKSSKSEVAMLKAKQSAGTLKADSYVQAAPGRSEKVKSPGILKNSSSKVNVESQKKNSRVDVATSIFTTSAKTASSKVLHKAKETSPKPALAHVKSLSLSLNADPQKKLPPIKTSRTGSKSAGSTAKNTANLCTECKAEVEGAVCFIGNDGRVSACTSRNAIRLCKNLKCANNNPEYVASLAAAIAAPKKYLVSRRHSLNLPRSTSGLPCNGKNVNKAVPEKNMDVQTSDENGTSSQNDELAVSLPPQQEGDHESTDDSGFDMKGELEEDVGSLEDDLSGEVGEIDGIASASPNGGRLNGYQRMRRRSFSVIDTQAPAEVVTLRKKKMQERKQAEEWMLDYAIEEALQKLAPSKDSRVKALVEAFESIIPNKEADATAATAAAQGHQSEGPKTPNKIAVAVQ